VHQVGFLAGLCLSEIADRPASALAGSHLWSSRQSICRRCPQDGPTRAAQEAGYYAAVRSSSLRVGAPAELGAILTHEADSLFARMAFFLWCLLCALVLAVPAVA
jgi:hypothetical protein